ncbi:MAG TPA: plastocyanin/azurin family copper-binding protein [Thermomicrobiales bacterium]|nr:plastocyanin/azurin family copper-binding protein [Thermomicrobiales bacterium]
MRDDAPWRGVALSRRRVLAMMAGALAAPLVAACGGGDDDVTPSASPITAGPRTHTVDMTDAPAFDPAELTIAAGDTVTFVSAGDTPHTTTCDPAKLPGVAALPDLATVWDSGPLQPGQRFSVRLTLPGTYTYACLEHAAEGMVGTIVVEG